MVRRKVVEPTAEEMNATPPRELLRFRPSQAAPTGPHGRPMPWAMTWEPEDFADFLRAREAWRRTHVDPLPSLPARERCALDSMSDRLPRAVVAAEEAGARGQRPPPYESPTTHPSKGRTRD